MELGITQNELAMRLKISQEAVCQQEERGIARVDIAIRYAKVMNCKPNELLDGINGETFTEALTVIFILGSALLLAWAFVTHCWKIN